MAYSVMLQSGLKLTWDGGGDSEIRSGGGNGYMIGGGGADTFRFGSIKAEGIQHQTILDFTPGVDRIALDVSQRQTTITDTEQGVVIDFGYMGASGSTILLHGVHRSELHASDFVFS